MLFYYLMSDSLPCVDLQTGTIEIARKIKISKYPYKF